MYFLLRGLRDRRYFRHFGERLGFVWRRRRFHETAHNAIWLHAVSVGEVLAGVELARRLRASFPHARLFVSVGTLAGRAAAEQKLAGTADAVCYAPVDYCSAVRRALRRLRPRVLVVLETEIWPNLWREAKRIGCGLVVVNGRISPRAMPRYARFGWFFGQVLALPDAILAQDENSRARYLELGAPAERARTAGNLKYDFDPARAAAPQAVLDFIERLHPNGVWIAASTMPAAEPGDPDEDDAVIAAFRELRQSHPGLLLILVPRKPERFDIAAEKLAAAGVRFARRTRLNSGAAADCLLVDSIGELSSLFRLSDVVFMGGSLARRGGHNILEPAFFGKPVIVGPHMENFPEIARRFRESGALIEIGEAGELAPAVDRVLRDPGETGARAKQSAEAERGATERAVAEIARVYGAAAPAYRPPTPALLALAPLAALWRIGNLLHGRFSRREKLSTPVVSVGGLSVGGAGKTPFVLWLSQELKARGVQPAVLTRGYRRREPEACIAAPGQALPAERTGDEAQAYLRAGVGPVGIGADRAAAGRAIEARFRPDIFVLDDGFQHYRLARDFDIVVLDGLDPFGGGHVLPLGRLREPISALARADAVVVTRAEPGSIESIRAMVPRGIPVFTVRTVPEGWFEAGTGTPVEAPAVATAFCGLGNPESFWRTLRDAGVETTIERAFPDHHRYSAGELNALAANGDVLVTTEKDAANLPSGPELPRVLWLKIGIEVERGGDLLALLAEKGLLPREIGEFSV